MFFSSSEDKLCLKGVNKVKEKYEYEAEVRAYASRATKDKMIYFFSCSPSIENKSFLSSASSSYFCFWRSSSTFFTSSSLSFSFAFSLYFSDSISIADFLLDLATFFLVPVKINYKRKKRQSVVFIYIKEQPKHQAPVSPRGGEGDGNM